MKWIFKCVVHICKNPRNITHSHESWRQLAFNRFSSLLFDCHLSFSVSLSRFLTTFLCTDNAIVTLWQTTKTHSVDRSIDFHQANTNCRHSLPKHMEYVSVRSSRRAKDEIFKPLKGTEFWVQKWEMTINIFRLFSFSWEFPSEWKKKWKQNSFRAYRRDTKILCQLSKVSNRQK